MLQSNNISPSESNMKMPLKLAEKTISTFISKCIKNVYNKNIPSETLKNSFSRPKPHFGEISVQFFRFSKEFKTKPDQSSKAIANEFQTILDKNNPNFDSNLSKLVENVKNEGSYLNFYLKLEFLSQILTQKNNQKTSNLTFFDPKTIDKTKDKVMIEYSQPNTHKAFHVGHMRNVAIGDSLVRLYEQLGHEVVAANYFGDEGAHVAKCTWLLQKTVTEKELLSIPELEKGEFLGALYSKAVEMLDFSTLTCFPVEKVMSAKVLEINKHPKNTKWNIVSLLANEKYTVVCAGMGYCVGDIVVYMPIGGKVNGKVVVEKEMEGVLSKGVVLGVSELPEFPQSSHKTQLNENDKSKKDNGISKKEKKGQQKNLKQIYILPKTIPIGIELCEYGKVTKHLFDIVLFIKSNHGKSVLWTEIMEHFSKQINFDQNAFILKENLNRFTGIITSKDKTSFSYQIISHNQIIEKYISFFRNYTNFIDENKKISEIFNERKMEVKKTLQNLESKEEATFNLWKRTQKWSLDDFERIYKWANCRFDHYFFESEVSEESMKLVDKFYEKGVLKMSDGCIGADLSKWKLGFCMLKKSNGSGLYATKDLQLALEKFDIFKIDRSIYVVDSAQTLHFQQVFRTLLLMGYKQAQKCRHLAYALVTLPNGKMSSRSGNIIVFRQLVNLLHENLKNRCFSDIKDNDYWTEEKIKKALHTISVGTIKYGMLNQDIHRTIVFNLDEWTNPNGNTGSYLMYQYTRIASILREVSFPSEGITDFSLLTHPNDRYILGQMNRFWEIIETCVERGSPMIMCNYLYDLCKAFSSWYKVSDNSVKHAKTASLKKTRLVLLTGVKNCLFRGLYLLGIDVLERM